MDSNKPTTANVLASLNVKGATVIGGPGKGGFIPVLGTNGTIDVSVIPTDAIADSLSIKSLSHTAYVDGEASGVENGSIAAPYKTVVSAAAAGFSNFCIETGSYVAETIDFSHENQSIVRFFGQNNASFDKITLTGYNPGTVFIFNNISVTDAITCEDATACSIIVTGLCHVGKIAGDISDASLPDNAIRYIENVKVGPAVTINEVVNVGSITYIVESSKIANSTEEIRGQTVEDAIDDLGSRKIRVPEFDYTDQGIKVSAYNDIDVPKEHDGKRGTTYDISGFGTSIVDAVNAIFHKDGDSPTYKDVSAEKIDADVVNSAEISTSKINFVKNGDIKAVVTVSDDNFLEIA